MGGVNWDEYQDQFGAGPDRRFVTDLGINAPGNGQGAPATPPFPETTEAPTEPPPEPQRQPNDNELFYLGSRIDSEIPEEAGPTTEEMALGQYGNERNIPGKPFMATRNSMAGALFNRRIDHYMEDTKKEREEAVEEFGRQFALYKGPGAAVGGVPSALAQKEQQIESQYRDAAKEAASAPYPVVPDNTEGAYEDVWVQFFGANNADQEQVNVVTEAFQKGAGSVPITDDFGWLSRDLPIGRLPEAAPSSVTMNADVPSDDMTLVTDREGLLRLKPGQERKIREHVLQDVAFVKGQVPDDETALQAYGSAAGSKTAHLTKWDGIMRQLQKHYPDFKDADIRDEDGVLRPFPEVLSDVNVRHPFYVMMKLNEYVGAMSTDPTLSALPHEQRVSIGRRITDMATTYAQEIAKDRNALIRDEQSYRNKLDVIQDAGLRTLTNLGLAFGRWGDAALYSVGSAVERRRLQAKKLMSGLTDEEHKSLKDIEDKGWLRNTSTLAHMFEDTLDRHPEWRQQPWNGIMDVFDFTKMVDFGMETTGYMGTIAAGGAVGGPVGGFAMAFARESSDMYAEARNSGASKEDAILYGGAAGLVVAGIEFMQLHGILQMARGTSRAAQKKAARQGLGRVLNKMGIRGKNLAEIVGKVKALRRGQSIPMGSLNEAIEEGLQYLTQEYGAQVIWDKDPDKNILDNLWRSMSAGGTMGMIFGAGGRVIRQARFGRMPSENALGLQLATQQAVDETMKFLRGETEQMGGLAERWIPQLGMTIKDVSGIMPEGSDALSEVARKFFNSEAIRSDESLDPKEREALANQADDIVGWMEELRDLSVAGDIDPREAVVEGMLRQAFGLNALKRAADIELAVSGSDTDMSEMADPRDISSVHHWLRQAVNAARNGKEPPGELRLGQQPGRKRKVTDKKLSATTAFRLRMDIQEGHSPAAIIDELRRVAAPRIPHKKYQELVRDTNAERDAPEAPSNERITRLLQFIDQHTVDATMGPTANDGFTANEALEYALWRKEEEVKGTTPRNRALNEEEKSRLRDILWRHIDLRLADDKSNTREQLKDRLLNANSRRDFSTIVNRIDAVARHTTTKPTQTRGYTDSEILAIRLNAKQRGAVSARAEAIGEKVETEGDFIRFMQRGLNALSTEYGYQGRAADYKKIVKTIKNLRANDPKSVQKAWSTIDQIMESAERSYESKRAKRLIRTIKRVGSPEQRAALEEALTTREREYKNLDQSPERFGVVKGIINRARRSISGNTVNPRPQVEKALDHALVLVDQIYNKQQPDVAAIQSAVDAIREIANNPEFAVGLEATVAEKFWELSDTLSQEADADTNGLTPRHLRLTSVVNSLLLHDVSAIDSALDAFLAETEAVEQRQAQPGEPRDILQKGVKEKLVSLQQLSEELRAVFDKMPDSGELINEEGQVNEALIAVQQAIQKAEQEAQGIGQSGRFYPILYSQLKRLRKRLERGKALATGKARKMGDLSPHELRRANAVLESIEQQIGEEALRRLATMQAMGAFAAQRAKEYAATAVDESGTSWSNFTKKLRGLWDIYRDFQYDPASHFGVYLGYDSPIVKGIRKLIGPANDAYWQTHNDGMTELSNTLREVFGVRDQADVSAIMRTISRDFLRSEQTLFSKAMGRDVGLDTRTIRLSNSYYATPTGKNKWGVAERNVSVTLTPAEAMYLAAMVQDIDTHDLIHRTDTQKQPVPIVLQSAIREGKPRYIALHPEDVGAIQENLTDQERELVDYFVDTFSGKFRELTNATSRNVRGYNLINTDRGVYCPRRRYPGAHHKPQTPGKSPEGEVYNVENAPFTKPRSQQSTDPLVVDDIFSVFARELNDVAEYSSFIEPMQELRAMFNHRDVQQAVREKYGNKVLAHLEKSMQRIERAGKGQRDTLSGPIDAFLSHMYPVALGAKPHIAVYQLLSSPYIAVEAHPDSVRKALHDPRLWRNSLDEKIGRIAPSYLARINSNIKSVVGAGEDIGAKLLDSPAKGKERVNEWLMWPTAICDRLAMRLSYLTAENEVKRQIAQEKAKGAAPAAPPLTNTDYNSDALAGIKERLADTTSQIEDAGLKSVVEEMGQVADTLMGQEKFEHEELRGRVSKLASSLRENRAAVTADPALQQMQRWADSRNIIPDSSERTAALRDAMGMLSRGNVNGAIGALSRLEAKLAEQAEIMEGIKEAGEPEVDTVGTETIRERTTGELVDVIMQTAPERTDPDTSRRIGRIMANEIQQGEGDIEFGAIMARLEAQLGVYGILMHEPIIMTGWSALQAIDVKAAEERKTAVEAAEAEAKEAGVEPAIPAGPIQEAQMDDQTDIAPLLQKLGYELYPEQVAALEEGTPEYDQAVLEAFNRIRYNTQPTFSGNKFNLSGIRARAREGESFAKILGPFSSMRSQIMAMMSRMVQENAHTTKLNKRILTVAEQQAAERRAEAEADAEKYLGRHLQPEGQDTEAQQVVQEAADRIRANGQQAAEEILAAAKAQTKQNTNQNLKKIGKTLTATTLSQIGVAATSVLWRRWLYGDDDDDEENMSFFKDLAVESFTRLLSTPYGSGPAVFLIKEIIGSFTDERYASRYDMTGITAGLTFTLRDTWNEVWEAAEAYRDPEGQQISGNKRLWRAAQKGIVDFGIGWLLGIGAPGARDVGSLAWRGMTGEEMGETFFGKKKKGKVKRLRGSIRGPKVRGAKVRGGKQR